MLRHRPSLPRLAAGFLLAATALAAPAFAEAEKKDPGPVVFLLVGVLVLLPSLQLLVAALAPPFVRRVGRALTTAWWPCFGWGALCLVLVVTVAGILSKGGKPGQGLMGLGLVLTAVLALAALSGLAKLLGDKVLANWGVASLGPLSVLIGATLLAWGCAIPYVGWAAGIVLLIGALGAGVQALLHPGAHDEPSPAAPPVATEEPPQ